MDLKTLREKKLKSASVYENKDGTFSLCFAQVKGCNLLYSTCRKPYDKAIFKTIGAACEIARSLGFKEVTVVLWKATYD